jgi:hypothetical protein
VESLERKGRVMLSTIGEWHMPKGKFEVQKSIPRLTKKLEPSFVEEKRIQVGRKYECILCLRLDTTGTQL